jgi:hypothetical protein
LYGYFNPFTLWEVCAYNGFSHMSIEIDCGAGAGRIRQSASEAQRATPLIALLMPCFLSYSD